MESGLRLGEPQVAYSARGIPSYSMELWHEGLKKHRVIRANDASLVQQKVRLQIEEWESRWEDASAKALVRSSRAQGKRRQEERKADAAEQTAAAIAELDALGSLLAATLDIDDTVDWETLKNSEPFPEAAPQPARLPPVPELPRAPQEPQPTEARFKPALGLLDKLIPSRKRKRHEEMVQFFSSELKKWRLRMQEHEKAAQELNAKYTHVQMRASEEHRQRSEAWSARKAEYLAEQQRSHALVDARRTAYMARDGSAVLDYCDLVLS